MSRRDTAISAKTLACLLQGLEGYQTTIELRNETSIFGKIDFVDGRMNTHLSNVRITLPDTSAKEYTFDTFFIKGANIRYVHIPDDVDIIATIERQLKMFDKKPEKPQTAPSVAVMHTRHLRERLQREKVARSKSATSSTVNVGASTSKQ